MTNEYHDVSTRLAQLENSLRRSRCLTALFVAVVIATWAVGGSADDPMTLRTVRTEQVIIEDAQGRDRIVLAAPMPDGREQVGMKILDPNGAEQFGLGLTPDGSISMGFDAKPGVGNPANRERLNMGVSGDGSGWIRWLDNNTRARMFIRTDSSGTAMLQFLEWPDKEKIVVTQITAAGDTTLIWPR